MKTKMMVATAARRLRTRVPQKRRLMMMCSPASAVLYLQAQHPVPTGVCFAYRSHFAVQAALHFVLGNQQCKHQRQHNSSSRL
jgi:hypothetical protein